MSDNNNMKKSWKDTFKTRRFKFGIYQTIITVIVLAVVLFINLVIGQFNKNIDLTSNDKYSLTDETKNFVNGVQDDITVYYMVKKGDETAEIDKVIDQYSSLSSHVKVVDKDPILYPTFASQYTKDQINENDVIVVNEKNAKSKHVLSTDMLVQNTDYQTQSTSTSLDTEGQITSAIQFVTTAESTKVYNVTGHNETAIGDTLKTSLEKANMSVTDLETAKTTAVPDDCKLLLVNGPTTDFSEDEVKMIKAYLEKGGDAVLIPNIQGQNLKQYESLLNYYGVSVKPGVVFETSGNYIGNYPHYIVPTFATHDITSSFTGNDLIVMPITQGLGLVDASRSTLKVEPFLNTSDEAYSKAGTQFKSADKEAGDTDGPFYLGLAATDSYRGEVTTKVVVFSTSNMFVEQMLSSGSLKNADLLIKAINWATDSKTTTLSIPSRSLDQTYLTVSSSQSIIWGIVLIFVLPALLLLSGVMVWYVRRKS